MLASQIVKPGELMAMQLAAPPAPGPDQVLVRVRRVGICGSDIHIYHGANPFASYPRIWGHEFVGEVAAVGSAVTTLAVGDHVAGEPIHYCGACYACRNGRGNVCEQLQVNGVHIDGGCREYMLLDRQKAHKIDPSVDWDVAVLAEPLTIGFESCGQGRVQAGDVVLVMGGGTIGLCVMLAAKSLGATCFITDIVPQKLEYARSLGADHTIDVTREDLSAVLMERTGGMGANVVVDSVCTRGSLEQALDLASAAGRVVELGMGDAPSAVPHVKLMRKELSLSGSRLQAGKFPAAIALLEANARRLSGFVTQRYPFDRIPAAFAFAEEHPEQVRKIAVEL